MPQKTTVFGGGCFWCTEAIFQMLKGVSKVEPGYAGSTPSTNSGQASSPQTVPTYESVATGKTGHAEVIRVTYDPSIISYQDLLTVFFGSHDPTTPNRQGYDVGEEYRSIILYQTDEEKDAAEHMIRDIEASLKEMSASYSHMPIVTQVVPLDTFYPAEDYHKNYYAQNTSAPYCQLIIEPKLEKVRKRFAELVQQ